MNWLMEILNSMIIEKIKPDDNKYTHIILTKIANVFSTFTYVPKGEEINLRIGYENAYALLEKLPYPDIDGQKGLKNLAPKLAKLTDNVNKYLDEETKLSSEDVLNMIENLIYNKFTHPVNCVEIDLVNNFSELEEIIDHVSQVGMDCVLPTGEPSIGAKLNILSQVYMRLKDIENFSLKFGEIEGIINGAIIVAMKHEYDEDLGVIDFLGLAKHYPKGSELKALNQLELEHLSAVNFDTSLKVNDLIEILSQYSNNDINTEITDEANTYITEDGSELSLLVKELKSPGSQISYPHNYPPKSEVEESKALESVMETISDNTNNSKDTNVNITQIKKGKPAHKSKEEMLEEVNAYKGLQEKKLASLNSDYDSLFKIIYLSNNAHRYKPYEKIKVAQKLISFLQKEPVEFTDREIEIISESTLRKIVDKDVIEEIRNLKLNSDTKQVKKTVLGQ